MLKMTEFDRTVLEKAVRDGILEKVDGEKIVHDINGEGQLIACSDGDQHDDMEDHLHRKGLHRRHTILVAGGPLALGPGSPARSLNSLFAEFVIYTTKDRKIGWFMRLLRPLLTLIGHLMRIDLFLLVQIFLGITKKMMLVVILMMHVPCAIAGDYHLDVVEQFKLVIGAKKRIKKKFTNNRVMLLIHVDWGNDTRNTFRFSGEKTLEWISQNRNFFGILKAHLAAQTRLIPS